MSDETIISEYLKVVDGKLVVTPPADPLTPGYVLMLTQHIINVLDGIGGVIDPQTKIAATKMAYEFYQQQFSATVQGRTMQTLLYHLTNPRK